MSDSISPSVVTAETRSGQWLPVIDVTNPRFAVADDPESLRRLLDASAKEERSRRYLPRFLLRLMIKSLGKRSLLARALFNTDSTFLGGLSTYVLKLGADNLPPPYDGPVDRKFAASAQLTLLRLRTQQTARLLADGLAEILEAGGAPLHLINIAGGPAIDSLNALLILRQSHPDLLRRRIVINVLDQDADGPFFGANALNALKADDRSLAGVDVTFVHHSYNWNDTSALTRLLRESAQTGAVVAASSEGGLFEYGGDDAVVANLGALHAGGVRLVVGSVTVNTKARRRSIAISGFKLIPRGLEGFAPLAERSGFRIARSLPIHFSDQVQLRPL
ncbi:MAG: hypothetical protein WC670_01060 [Pseudolabrys sp.]